MAAPGYSCDNTLFLLDLAPSNDLFLILTAQASFHAIRLFHFLEGSVLNLVDTFDSVDLYSWNATA